MKRNVKLIFLITFLLSALSLCFACDIYSSDSTKPHNHVFERKVSDEYLKSPATCTSKAEYYFSCEICGQRDTNTFEYGDYGHKLTVYKGVEPTCTENGITEGKVCSICNEIIAAQETIPALGHNLIPHNGKLSTCTEKGFAAYETCTRCDYTTYRELPLAEHELDNGFCRICGQEITPHNHIEVVDKGKPATCLEQGVTDGKHCSVCNKILLEQKIIPALGHNILSYDALAATCTKSGHSAYETCTRCDFSTYIEIPALGHNLTSHQAKNATCTDFGWNAYKDCSRCNYTTYEPIPALGHDYISHKGKAAKCDEVGYADYETCSRCDFTTFEEIPALGHSFNDGSCITCGELDPAYSKYYNFTTLSGGTYSISINNSTYNKAQKLRIPATYNGKTVTEIGKTAFSSYSSLKSVIIPYTITSIGERAFYDCTSLEEIIVSRNCKNYYSVDNCLIAKTQKTLIAGCKNSVIPTDGSIENIENYAFYNCADLEQITIPDSVVSIGEQSFYGCSKLKEITISDSVISIGTSAFNGCGSLSEIYLGNGITEIKSRTFANCNSLTSITIPNSVTTIGSYAFSDCTGLTSIIIPNSVTTIANNAFQGCTNLGNIDIPNSVTYIGDSAFANCTGLLSITIGESVTSIRDLAFDKCSSLTTVTWNAINCTYAGYDTLVTTVLGNDRGENHAIFRSCYNIKNVNIGNKVQYIPEYAFENGSCKSVIIPTGVTTIKNSAFRYWSNLSVVYYMGTAAQWEKILIENTNNSYLLDASRYYYSETKPTEEGDYWHYDENGNVVEW